MKNNFSGTFEFFCVPTKTADNKKSKIYLTAGYEFECFCDAMSFWDEKVNMKIQKEYPEIKDVLIFEDEFTVVKVDPGKGSKGVKNYTIILEKLFNLEKHLILDKFLNQNVSVSWSKKQKEIDFGVEDVKDPEE